MSANADASLEHVGPAGDDQPDLHVLPVVREELVVGRRSVETGRVRISRQVHAEPVEERVALTRTVVRVERMETERMEDSPPLPREEGGLLIVPVFDEVLVKRWRVTGEVHVSEERVTEEVTVRETLRRAEVTVERVGVGVAPGRV